MVLNSQEASRNEPVITGFRVVKGPFLEKSFVDPPEDQSAAERAQGIGEPVPRVIAGAVLKKGLMKFVPNSDDRKGDRHHDR